MGTISTAPYITVLSAELFVLLLRSRDIQILVKRDAQLTPGERSLVKRGLLRSLLLEMVVFVPASATLVILSMGPMLVIAGIPGRIGDQAFSALLGILSYGFPFATMRRVVTRLALRTLREFAAITLEARKVTFDSAGDRSSSDA